MLRDFRVWKPIETLKAYSSDLRIREVHPQTSELADVESFARWIED
jgi:hypothetical protein